MNRYGVMAQKYWAARWPAELAAMSNPESFFSSWGLQIAQEIDVLADQIAGPDQPDETTLEKLGRIRSARFDAESDVLRSFFQSLTTTEEDEDDALPAQAPWVSQEEIAAWQEEAEAEMSAES